MSRTLPTVQSRVWLMRGACAMAALIHRPQKHLRAPEWIALLVAGIFGLAGLFMTAQARACRALAGWLACVPALGRQPAAQPSTDADAPSPHPVAPREDHP